VIWNKLPFQGDRLMAKTDPPRLSADRLRELARTGAAVALERMREEIAAIERAFPELASSEGRSQLGQSLNESVKSAQRRAWRMSAAGRKAVSDRMKRYWAERRQAQARTKSPK
jgi:hypothetical protein